ncbi:MAG TPA: lysophospholipid acyltransferase family protein [Pyrinomonadaceae bacterium]|nr:lysophospholipid acyltransferase family protein [Pyrinomonadaceae bacterium]
MTRRIIIALLRFTLRIYYRRVEIAGLEHVPETDPVIFVLNHPNALVDPSFLLCLAPRRVSFLAKAPLFGYPVIGAFVRALNSLPAYRQQDKGQDVSKNQETFAAAAKWLSEGGTIGICPEGISHDRPGLQPIKTGAARIALGAVATGQAPNLKIVPAGLYYTSKSSFRSDALLYFGKPIEVTPQPLEDGAPSRAAVKELSKTIEAALREVMLDAQHEDALQVISRAEEIFSSESDNESSGTLARELQLRQQFIKGYAALSGQAPERIKKLEARIIRFDQQLRQAGVDPVDLSPPRSTAAVLFQIIKRVTIFLLMLAPATIGIVVHFPAYKLGGVFSSSLFRNTEDVVSTIKIISAMLFFPLTWLIVAGVGYAFAGWWAVLVILPLLPLCGYVAMRFLEAWEASLGGLRALTFFLMRRRFFVRMLAERRAIKAEILALGNEAALGVRSN